MYAAYEYVVSEWYPIKLCQPQAGRQVGRISGNTKVEKNSRNIGRICKGILTYAATSLNLLGIDYDM